MPPVSPRQGSCLRRAAARPGRTFSRQVRLRQIRRRPPQDLVLVLEQPDSLASFAELGALRSRPAEFGSVVDCPTLQPFLQRHRVNTKIVRDLLDRHFRLTTTRNTSSIITALTGIRLRHNNIFSGHPGGQANSDVTSPCSRPIVMIRSLSLREAHHSLASRRRYKPHEKRGRTFVGTGRPCGRRRSLIRTPIPSLSSA